MIHRMHSRSQCPSEMFADMDLSKVFVNMNNTEDSDGSETKSQEERRGPRSQVISLREKRVKRVEGPCSDIGMGY